MSGVGGTGGGAAAGSRYPEVGGVDDNETGGGGGGATDIIGDGDRAPSHPRQLDEDPMMEISDPTFEQSTKHLKIQILPVLNNDRSIVLEESYNPVAIRDQDRLIPTPQVGGGEGAKCHSESGNIRAVFTSGRSTVGEKIDLRIGSTESHPILGQLRPDGPIRRI